MAHPQFRKFKIDWNVFKQITAIPPHQIAAWLYNLCDDSVQNTLINTVTYVFQLPEEDLVKVIESAVTKRSNPTVHCMHFGNIIESRTELIQEHTVCLKWAAIDCEFSCLGCQFDLATIHVKDQFIRGLFNHTLQTDILAKADHLKTLKQIIAHAKAFETALRLRDQSKLCGPSDPSISKISDYRKQRHIKANCSSSPCLGCGSQSHGPSGSNDQSTKFPAWGKNCLNCNITNHFAKVCRKERQNPGDANALTAQVQYDQQKRYLYQL